MLTNSCFFSPLTRAEREVNREGKGGWPGPRSGDKVRIRGVIAGIEREETRPRATDGRKFVAGKFGRRDIRTRRHRESDILHPPRGITYERAVYISARARACGTRSNTGRIPRQLIKRRADKLRGNGRV